MDYGALTAARLRSGQWLHWGIRFFLAAALTASETVDGYAPFALGCIAAAGPGAGGAAALGGGVMGALLFLPFQQALAFAAVGILTVTAATAFRDTDFFKRPWVMPVLAAGMVLAVGGIYACQALDPVSSIGPCAAAGLLTGVSTYFFARLFQGEEDRLSPEGLLFLGAALTLALGDLTVLNVSVGRTLLCALLACTAYGQGPMTGVTAGLGLGLVTDLTVGTGRAVHRRPTAWRGCWPPGAAAAARRHGLLFRGTGRHAHLPGSSGHDAAAGNHCRSAAVFGDSSANFRRQTRPAGGRPRRSGGSAGENAPHPAGPSCGGNAGAV